MIKVANKRLLLYFSKLQNLMTINFNSPFLRRVSIVIISVHMPKCGGSSFKELLDRRFGKRVMEDNDYPIHQSFSVRTRKAERARKWGAFADKYLYRYSFTECIHGHFLAYKYDFFYGRDDTIFVTWLRDPIERLGSHYYFWQRTYTPWKRTRPLHKRVIKENWSLEKFAFSEEIRNIYTTFLWNFPVERFDFIGLTEFYEDDLNYFSRKYLGLDEVAVPQKNVNPGRSKKYFEDPKLIEELKAFHARDYEIYEYARNLRNERISQANW